MNVGEALRLGAERLTAAGSQTARLDAELLLGDALGLARVELYTGFDRPLNGGERKRFRRGSSDVSCTSRSRTSSASGGSAG